MSSHTRLFCDPRGCTPPGSSVHEISQARLPEWVVTPFSRVSPQSRDRTVSPTLTGGLFTAEPPRKPCYKHTNSFYLGKVTGANYVKLPQDD